MALVTVQSPLSSLAAKWVAGGSADAQCGRLTPGKQAWTLIPRTGVCLFAVDLSGCSEDSMHAKDLPLLHLLALSQKREEATERH